MKEDGDPVYYLDEDGNEVEVDEPTGGLILDDKTDMLSSIHITMKK